MKLGDRSAFVMAAAQVRNGLVHPHRQVCGRGRLATPSADGEPLLGADGTPPSPTSPLVGLIARPVALTAEELAWISGVGADFRADFDAPTTTLRERQQLIRSVIAEVGKIV